MVTTTGSQIPGDLEYNNNGTTGTMKQEQTRELYAYWKELYSIHGIPERAMIEPSAIRGLLGDTFILEFDPDGQVYYRLAGTRLCAAFATELKGTIFGLHWALDEKSTLENIISAIGEDAIIAVVGSRATSQKGRSLSLETLILPLLHNHKKSRRLLGITTPLSRPFWLGTDPVVSQSITSMRIIDPALDKEPFNTRFTLKRSNPPEPVLKIPNGRRIKHLTVVEGGKTSAEETPGI